MWLGRPGLSGHGVVAEAANRWSPSSDPSGRAGEASAQLRASHPPRSCLRGEDLGSQATDDRVRRQVRLVLGRDARSCAPSGGATTPPRATSKVPMTTPSRKRPRRWRRQDCGNITPSGGGVARGAKRPYRHDLGDTCCTRRSTLAVRDRAHDPHLAQPDDPPSLREHSGTGPSRRRKAVDTRSRGLGSRCARVSW
jgi:hypothetical protein